MKLRRVEIVWRDASFHSDTRNREEAEAQDLIELHLIGYVVSETDEKIVVAQEYDPKYNCFRYIHAIPKNGIVTTTELNAVEGGDDE